MQLIESPFGETGDALFSSLQRQAEKWGNEFFVELEDESVGKRIILHSKRLTEALGYQRSKDLVDKLTQNKSLVAKHGIKVVIEPIDESIFVNYYQTDQDFLTLYRAVCRKRKV